MSVISSRTLVRQNPYPLINNRGVQQTLRFSSQDHEGDGFTETAISPKASKKSTFLSRVGAYLSQKIKSIKALFSNFPIKLKLALGETTGEKLATIGGLAIDGVALASGIGMIVHSVVIFAGSFAILSPLSLVIGLIGSGLCLYSLKRTYDRFKSISDIVNNLDNQVKKSQPTQNLPNAKE